MIDMDFDDIWDDTPDTAGETPYDDGSYQDGFEDAGVIFLAATERNDRDYSAAGANQASQDSMAILFILVAGGLLCLCLL